MGALVLAIPGHQFSSIGPMAAALLGFVDGGLVPREST